MGIVQESQRKLVDRPDEATLQLDWVRRAHAGDPSAQRALIEHLQGSVRRTVFYLAGPYRDIDDLSQLALVEILYAAGTFRGESSLARWAEKITVRTALKHLKAQRRKDRVADEWQDELPAFQDIDLDVDARRVRMRLAVLMQDLNAACRAAMVLHYVHGYRIPEVADITGAKINTVRGRLKSGRTKLRRRILADTLLREWVKGVYK